MVAFRKVGIVCCSFLLLLSIGCTVSKAVRPSSDYSGMSAYEVVLREAEARGIVLTSEEKSFAAAQAEQDLIELEKTNEAGLYSLEDLISTYRYELLFKRLSMIFVPDSGVTEEALKNWYEERFSALEKAYADNPGVFKSQQEQYDRFGGVPPLIVPEGYIRVHHILVENRETAQEVLNLLAAGESVQQLMERYNIDEGMNAEPYRTLGYLIGPYDATRDYLPEMKAAALALSEAGQVSGIVESSAGFHIIQLDDKLMARSLSFDMVRDDIFTLLDAYEREQAFNVIIQEWID